MYVPLDKNLNLSYQFNNY